MADETTTSCDGLSSSLLNATTGDVVILEDDEACVGHFDLPEGQSITFKGGAGLATLSGGNQQQILAGHDTGSTIIEGLTFVEGNASEGDGGAIRLTGDSAVTIRDNTFLNNAADEDGGAVSIDSEESPPETRELTRGDASPIILSGNTFGAIEEDEGGLRTFDGNDAGDEGGAVYINDPFRPVVVHEGNEFFDSEAEDDGGGLSVLSGQEIVLLDNLFQGNDSEADGGGAELEVCSTAEVARNRFIDNNAGDVDNGLEGGGLAVFSEACFDNLTRGAGPQLVQSDNLFEGNSIDGRDSSGIGGGEYIDDIATVSTGDTFVGNEITTENSGEGAGLAFEGSGATPFIARNLVAAGNVIALESGEEAPLPVRGTPIENSVGGGLWLGGRNSEFRIEDSTIEGNVAALGSGIGGRDVFQQPGLRGEVQGSDALVLENTIVFGNEGAADAPGIPFDGEIAGFFERAVQSSDVCVDGAPHSGTGNICADPKLVGPVGDGNVDQTAESPTRDAGNSDLVDEDLTEDYAGDGRKLEARVDIGADEYKPAPVVPVTPAAPQQPAAAAGGVAGATQRSCVSRRVFRIRIRVPKGQKAVSATVRVNGKKVKVVRGKRLRAAVRLRGLPKGRFSVRITVRLANGKRITGVRRYHTCIPKLPGDGPPKV